MRRHWVMTGLIVVLVLIAGSAGAYWYWINHELSNVKRVDVTTIDRNPHPVGQPHEKDQALNILLLGADNGHDTQSVSEDLKDGKWTPFIHRSDTLMIAHIPADRKSVQLVSIPRDTWVKIDGYPYDNGHGKINAAFAYGGPSLAVKTVKSSPASRSTTWQSSTGPDSRTSPRSSTGSGCTSRIRSTTIRSASPGRRAGTPTRGQMALAYVRTRHGLANGDFDRIDRQQNFLRATMGKVLSQTHNIVSVTKIVEGHHGYLTIDSKWDNGEIINLALSLRSIKNSRRAVPDRPLRELRYEPGRPEHRASGAGPEPRALQRRRKNDQIAKYLHKYPNAELKGNKSVS